MAIKFSKFVDITSGVGGASAAARRDMGLRVFTSSDVITYNSVLTCNEADEVKSIFGADSNEYSIALNYFGYISKAITKAKQISFVRWASADIKQTTLTGNVSPSELSSFTGSVGVRITKDKGAAGAVSADISISIGDGEVAESYEAVANLFTSAMLKSNGDYAWLKGSSCDYEKGRFVFTFTASGTSPSSGPSITLEQYAGEDGDVVSVVDKLGFTLSSPYEWKGTDWSAKPESPVAWSASSGYEVGSWVTKDESVYCCKTAIASPAEGKTIAWNSSYWAALDTATAVEWTNTTLYSVGDLVKKTVGETATYYGCVNSTLNINAQVAAETPVDAVSRVESIENNFGSFMFVEALDVAKITKIAKWTHEKNYEYHYFVYCTFNGDVSYDALSSALEGYTCVSKTFCNRRDEFPEFMPASLFASTDYTRVNSTKTFMFKQFAGVSPSVGLRTDPTVQGKPLYKVLDEKLVNYYGQTMKSGKSLCFYQDGNNTDGTETAVACNEIWMKDAIKTEIINLFIAMERVPPNNKGLAMITMQVQGVINEAISNGVITPGKELTNVQKQYIDSVTGVSESYKTVINDGYWFGISVKTDSSAGYTKYKADYTLVYSKGDSIRKVTGSDIMV